MFPESFHPELHCVFILSE